MANVKKRICQLGQFEKSSKRDLLCLVQTLLQRVIEKYYKLYYKCARMILKLCAVGLDLPSDYFQRMFFEGGEDKHISTFRILHYPPRVEKKSLSDPEIPISTPEHSDSSILTLLCTFDNFGLQVKKENEWIWVEPVKDRYKS